MSWKTETFGSLLTESRIPCNNPDIEKRIRVKLNVQGVEKRPVGAEKKGATKQFIRKAGQFIYGKQNFHKGAFGVIPEELDGFETSADIPSFDVREDCLPEWIYYFFKAGNRYLELTEFARGVGSQRIHPKQLQDLEIPLPPIDVQRKIIAELEIIEKDEISTELTHQLDLVNQLRQAFLREAMQGRLVPQDINDEPASVLLEKIKAEKERLIKEKKIKKQKPLPPITEDEIPFEIPENWVCCRLGELIYDTEGGKSPNCQNVPAEGDQWGVIKTTAIQEMIFLENENKILPEKYVVNPRHIVENGDVLITRAGPKNRVGIVCCVEDLSLNLILSDKTIRILHNKELVNSKFMALALNSPLIKPIIESKMTGMADSQVNISQDNMKRFLIPFPPLSEQQHIVAKLDELMQYCDELEESIKESQQQNELLLQQVLREALEPKEKEVERV
jgi:type I restriction enzyme S subunit